VYFLERGIRSSEKRFPDEAGACGELWARLAWYRGKAAARQTESPNAD